MVLIADRHCTEGVDARSLSGSDLVVTFCLHPLVLGFSLLGCFPAS